CRIWTAPSPSAVTSSASTSRVATGGTPCFSRREATITTSGSTRGRGVGPPHLPGARRVCTTSRFSTRTAKPSPGLCAACSMPVCRSKAQPTTASAKRSTCGTPTATASSCTATDQRANGPGPPTAPSPCRRGRWISRACWPRRNDRPTEFLSRSSYRSPSPPAPVSGRIEHRAPQPFQVRPPLQRLPGDGAGAVVEHDDRLDRVGLGGVRLGVLARPDQALLLPGEEYESDGALRFQAGSRDDPSRFEGAHG